MIIKGGSRGGPSQLAWHLQRRDTNESIQILELQSPAPNLKEAFRDWQTLVEGTRGFKGLYHVNIDPAKDYVMTREQWERAVDILEEELKLQGQPRAVVMHEKHGRQHIHVVWARTDIDRMVLRSDSLNYQAHERASQRLELEFGHEQVPGKHAKRDRKKQREFPRADANQAEWQEGERTGIHPSDRKDQITALRQACDTGHSFKTALEQHGYTLARGNRGYVIVDETGSIHALARQLRDMKASDLRAFMNDVPLDKLPDAEDVARIQRERHQEHPMEDETHPENAEPKPEKPQKPKEQPKTEEASPPQHKREAPASVTTPGDAEKWLAYYAMKLDQHAFRLDRLEFQLPAILEREKNKELEAYVAGQRAEMDALKKRLREETSGIRAYIEAREPQYSQTLGAEKAADRRRDLALMKRGMEREERDYITPLMEELRKRPVQQLADTFEKLKAEAKHDLDCYVREAERNRQIGRTSQDERERAEKETRDREQKRQLEQKREPQPEHAEAKSEKADRRKDQLKSEEPSPYQEKREAPPSLKSPDDADKWLAYYALKLEQHSHRLERLQFELGAILEREKNQELLVQMDALKKRLREETSGVQGYIYARESRLNPTLGAEKAAERRRDHALMKQRLEREHKDSLQLILEELKQRPVQELIATVQKLKREATDDLERYLKEAERYRQIDLAFQAERQRAEKENRDREQKRQLEQKREQQNERRLEGDSRPPEPAKQPPQLRSDFAAAQLEGITKAATDRAAEERRQLTEKHTAELNQLRETIARDTRLKLDAFDAGQRQQAEALRRQQDEARSGLRGVVESVRNFFSPTRAAAQEAERRREQDDLARRQKQEREAYLARLEKTNQLEIRNVTERNALRLQQHATKSAQDLDRYVQEHEAARKFRAEREERERERAEERARAQRKEGEPLKDGPERPPPTRAR